MEQHCLSLLTLYQKSSSEWIITVSNCSETRIREGFWIRNPFVTTRLAHELASLIEALISSELGDASDSPFAR